MKIRDRVKEFARVPVEALIDNPRNWRRHPERQKTALAGVLEEIGFAGAVLVREMPDGGNGARRYEIIDGHLRKELLAAQEVPVLVTNLTRKEADLLLAVYDPLSAMAETDSGALAALLAEAEVGDQRCKELLASIKNQEFIETPPDEFPKFDESAADDMKYLECPKCGHKFPK